MLHISQTAISPQPHVRQSPALQPSDAEPLNLDMSLHRITTQHNFCSTVRVAVADEMVVGITVILTGAFLYAFVWALARLFFGGSGSCFRPRKTPGVALGIA